MQGKGLFVDLRRSSLFFHGMLHCKNAGGKTNRSRQYPRGQHPFKKHIPPPPFASSITRILLKIKYFLLFIDIFLF